MKYSFPNATAGNTNPKASPTRRQRWALIERTLSALSDLTQCAMPKTSNQTFANNTGSKLLLHFVVFRVSEHR